MSAAAPKSERGSMQDLSTGMQQVNNDDDDSLDAESRRAGEKIGNNAKQPCYLEDHKLAKEK
jgi:hypothetical protein